MYRCNTATQAVGSAPGLNVLNPLYVIRGGMPLRAGADEARCSVVIVERECVSAGDRAATTPHLTAILDRRYLSLAGRGYEVAMMHGLPAPPLVKKVIEQEGRCARTSTASLSR
jgi:hypothetical protein